MTSGEVVAGTLAYGPPTRSEDWSAPLSHSSESADAGAEPKSNRTCNAAASTTAPLVRIEAISVAVRIRL